MADYFLSDLVETTALVNTDLLHIRTAGNVDKKVQFLNLVKTFRDILNKNVNYTILDADRNPIILVDSTTGNKTITLPTLAANQNKQIDIIKLVGANNVIVDGEGGETINWDTVQTLYNQYEYIKLIGIASTWLIAGRAEIRTTDIKDDAVTRPKILADAVGDQELDLGVGANQIDGDVTPLGTIVSSSPTGGTATNLAAASFIRAAIQEAFNRLKNLSGVQNDSIDSRLYINNSIDEEHINWGTAAGQIGLLKGHLAITLTNYDGVGVPQIAALGSCEINGQLYTNPIVVTITGATVNDTWYDILLTPSGTTYTASYIARGTGVWLDSKQGLYSGNNRVIGCVKRLAAADFRNKNIFIITNRTAQIKIEIGDWDMSDATGSAFKNVSHGLVREKIRAIDVMIIKDVTGTFYPLVSPYDIAINVYKGGSFDYIHETHIYLKRTTGGIFDNTNFDATGFNRGWITIWYEE